MTNTTSLEVTAETTQPSYDPVVLAVALTAAAVLLLLALLFISLFFWYIRGRKKQSSTELDGPSTLQDNIEESRSYNNFSTSGSPPSHKQNIEESLKKSSNISTTTEDCKHKKFLSRSLCSVWPNKKTKELGSTSNPILLSNGSGSLPPTMGVSSMFPLSLPDPLERRLTAPSTIQTNPYLKNTLRKNAMSSVYCDPSCSVEKRLHNNKFESYNDILVVPHSTYEETYDLNGSDIDFHNDNISANNIKSLLSVSMLPLTGSMIIPTLPSSETSGISQLCSITPGRFGLSYPRDNQAISSTPYILNRVEDKPPSISPVSMETTNDSLTSSVPLEELEFNLIASPEEHQLVWDSSYELLETTVPSLPLTAKENLQTNPEMYVASPEDDSLGCCTSNKSLMWDTSCDMLMLPNSVTAVVSPNPSPCVKLIDLVADIQQDIIYPVKESQEEARRTKLLLTVPQPNQFQQRAASSGDEYFSSIYGQPDKSDGYVKCTEI